MDRVQVVLDRLRHLADPSRLAGMSRYGIAVDHALGVSIPDLRQLARELRHDHELALGLWGSGIHEARILAGMIDDPSLVTAAQMDSWARDLDSWDVCDQVCMNLFVQTRHALTKARAWSRRRAVFEKRAGLALIACIAVRHRDLPDEEVEALLALIEAQADDERNYVRKAASWALRQIGKRSEASNRAAIAAAERIRARGSRAARWIASDATRELTSTAVQERLKAKLAVAARARATRAPARGGRPGTRRPRPPR